LQIFRPANSPGSRVSLLHALAISLVFHVLLLWPAAGSWRETTPTAALVASIRPAPAPVTPAPAILPATSSPARVEQKAKPEPPPPLALPAERPESATASPLDSTAGSAAGSESKAEPPASDPRPAVASALPPGPGADAEGLRRYRLALAREAGRHKRYPPRAIEAGWQGTAELRVSATAAGATAVQLARSSGHPVLDEAALEMLRLALPATPIPAPLQAREFSVALPIVFELPQ
jgi:protein TonB